MSDMTLAEELGKAIDEAESAGTTEGTAAPAGDTQGDASIQGAGTDTATGASGTDTTVSASGTDRTRDESGRFVKKDEKTEAVGNDAQATQATQSETQAQGVDLPPSTWTPGAKAAYLALPADSPIRQEIKKREADYQKGITQYKQNAEVGERLLNEMRPYEAIIRSQGGTPETVIRNLLNTAYLLNTGTPQQKAQLLIQAAKQYGADLTAFQGQPQATDGQFDPKALTPIVQQLVQPYVEKFNQVHSRFQTAQQQAEQARQHEAQSQIEAFRTATDEKGQPKHAYYDNVRGMMASFIESGHAQSLDQAYEMACRAHPEVSQAISAAQRKEADAKQLEEARRKAEDARRATAVNVSGQGGVGIADTSKMSLRDELAAQMDGRM